MIWFDAVVEIKASNDQLRRAICAVSGCAYDDVAVIEDIADIDDHPLTCFCQVLPDGGFEQQLSLYVDDAATPVRERLSIAEVATLLARQFGCRILIEDDDSASPHAMVLGGSIGSPGNVSVDPDALDEHGIFRLA